MVSRLPVFSGKTVRMRVPPEMVLPVFVSVVFFVALLIGYPWHILSFGSVLYLLSLPWGWKSYRTHERNAAAAAQAAPAAGAAAPSTAPPTLEPAPSTAAPGSPASSTAAPSDTEDERPTRLN
jgi:CDP-diacylglycerol--serine O-phosphatidyltransferase